jgi:hypothetical protein
MPIGRQPAVVFRSSWRDSNPCAIITNLSAGGRDIPAVQPPIEVLDVVPQSRNVGFFFRVLSLVFCEGAVRHDCASIGTGNMPFGRSWRLLLTGPGKKSPDDLLQTRWIAGSVPHAFLHGAMNPAISFGEPCLAHTLCYRVK